MAIELSREMYKFLRYINDQPEHRATIGQIYTRFRRDAKERIQTCLDKGTLEVVSYAKNDYDPKDGSYQTTDSLQVPLEIQDYISERHRNAKRDWLLRWWQPILAIVSIAISAIALFRTL